MRAEAAKVNKVWISKWDSYHNAAQRRQLLRLQWQLAFPLCLSRLPLPLKHTHISCGKNKHGRQLIILKKATLCVSCSPSLLLSLSWCVFVCDCLCVWVGGVCPFLCHIMDNNMHINTARLSNQRVLRRGCLVMSNVHSPGSISWICVCVQVCECVLVCVPRGCVELLLHFHFVGA